MPIVRSDKRQTAIALLKNLRVNIEETMRQCDGLQALAESLELELGLASEGEQSQRPTFMVLHYPKGSEVGHTLDECTDECAADEVLEDLGESTDTDEDEASQDDRGDGSGTGD